jgi:hypothetical protein
MAIDEFVSGRFPCLLFSVNFDLTTAMTTTITSEFRVYGIYSRQSSTCGIFWPLFLTIARLIGATQASCAPVQDCGTQASTMIDPYGDMDCSTLASTLIAIISLPLDGAIQIKL